MWNPSDAEIAESLGDLAFQLAQDDTLTGDEQLADMITILAYAHRRETTVARLADAGLTATRPCVKCGQDASTGPARITSAGTRHVGGCP